MSESCKSRADRSRVHSWIWYGLRFSALAVSTFAWTQPTWGQLRTGRETDREFYSESPAATESPSRRVAKNNTNQPHRESRVTMASHKTVKATATGVVQAGCKNCQAGIPHSHPPIASESENTIVSESVPEVAFETGVASEHSSCDNSCRATVGCSEIGAVEPMSFLSQLICRTQLRIEAATFWPEGQNLPQLVTTRRPANDPATDGLIGRTDTISLFGGGESLGGSTQGIRGELGTYFDACQNHGIVLRFFDAGSNSESFSSTPMSEPVVMRPFFSTTNNAQATIAVNYPDSTSGSLDARISSELYGGDILFRKLLFRDCAGRMEFLAGYQTARLADDLLIASTTTALTNTPAPQGTISTLSDHFATTNRFNGLALGLNGIMRDRCWSLAGMIKLGMGNMERSVMINGSSTITVPGNPPSTNTTTNGLLARNTNEGSYLSNTFVVSPEVNLTLGYRLTRGLEATVGYGYLGLPKVARVSDQLDPQLAANLSNPLTGAIRPSFELLESNFSLHSLNYGLQWRY
ncbi:MAG: BBP7 family outer membrane beta-barrel protein [Pirellula sp.]